MEKEIDFLQTGTALSLRADGGAPDGISSLSAGSSREDKSATGARNRNCTPDCSAPSTERYSLYTQRGTNDSEAPDMCFVCRRKLLQTLVHLTAFPFMRCRTCGKVSATMTRTAVMRLRSLGVRLNEPNLKLNAAAMTSR